MATYGASKAFLLSFSDSLIEELKDTGITVTALLPGAADTDFFFKAHAENTVTYREEDLYDPKAVARTAYKALMNGKRRVVPGVKNKIQAVVSNVLPDEKLAATMHAQMSPSHKAEGREYIKHPASREERERIEEATGSKSGDYESYPN
jgi:short-subunit dehydrogenase